MERVVIFIGSAQSLESSVNEWLRINPFVRITRALQSQSESKGADYTITMSIFYASDALTPQDKRPSEQY